MKIVMVRHGLSEANMKRVISGSNDVKLSEKGKQDLVNLREKTKYPQTDVYVSSSLSRCIDTFEILYPDKKLDRTDDRFKEICFGDIEGHSILTNELDDFFPKFFNNENVCNNELYSDFCIRIEDGLKDVLKELEKNNKYSATIVAHSTVIKVFIKLCENVPPENYRKVIVQNGQGYVFDIDLIDDEIVYNSVEKLI